MDKDTANIWDDIYLGGGFMNYPDDLFVRLLNINTGFNGKPFDVLDFGFGSGATTLHLNRIGGCVSGLEVSQQAIDITRRRLKREGYDSRLDVYKPGNSMPFQNSSFDLVVAWQVLNYNIPETFTHTVASLYDALKKRGNFISALAAPGGYIDQISVESGKGYKIISQGNQKGAKVVVPTEKELRDIYFKDIDIKVGVHETDLTSFDGNVARYWVVCYEK